MGFVAYLYIWNIIEHIVIMQNVGVRGLNIINLKQIGIKTTYWSKLDDIN